MSLYRSSRALSSSMRFKQVLFTVRKTSRVHFFVFNQALDESVPLKCDLNAFLSQKLRCRKRFSLSFRHNSLSSELSVQSVCLSKIHSFGVHPPTAHWNCFSGVISSQSFRSSVVTHFSSRGMHTSSHLYSVSMQAVW